MDPAAEPRHASAITGTGLSAASARCAGSAATGSQFGAEQPIALGCKGERLAAARPAAKHLACLFHLLGVASRALVGLLAASGRKRVKALATLCQLQRAAQRQRGAQVLAFALAWLLVLAVLAWRLASWPLAALAAGLALLSLQYAWRSAAALDRAWLILRLNAARAELEDSCALLFADPAGLNTLAQLQRELIAARVDASCGVQLRTAWPVRSLSLLWALSLALVAGLWAWPGPQRIAPGRELARAVTPVAAEHTRLLGAKLLIHAPAYTGLKVREESALQLSVVEGARVDFALHLSPNPSAAALRFHDGTSLPLQFRAQRWRASRAFPSATLFRIVIEQGAALADDRLYQIKVTRDAAPQIKVLAPERSLNPYQGSAPVWPLHFEASDDYALASAELEITLASGSGENIAVKAQRSALAGVGSTRARSYQTKLALGPLGFAAGDDLIVRFSVRDTRTPNPQTARSGSLILRWQGQSAGESTGIEGVVQRVLPAYFRSQRQIIIDTEALLAERKRLSSARFGERSDAIGVDQRLLRMRYGQFLGEETQSAANALPEGHSADDGHDHAALSTPSDASAAVLQEYGHSHDHAEAATLLDPQTRGLLKAAVNEMWQSELHLRQGQPQLALPYELRALALIKQVQQASRIYLARVGLELPPIDLARRLTGARDGLANRATALVPATAINPIPSGVWQALAPGNAVTREQLEALATWLREQPTQAVLEQLVALDRLLATPSCTDCAAHLRSLLWVHLARPATAVELRAASEASGKAYLKALASERQ